MQAFNADVMIAEVFTPCTALLANKLDLPWVNHWPIAPVEPFLSSTWIKGNRRLSQPNPLSYHPQFNTRVTTQRMVGSGPFSRNACNNSSSHASPASACTHVCFLFLIYPKSSYANWGTLPWRCDQ